MTRGCDFAFQTSSFQKSLQHNINKFISVPLLMYPLRFKCLLFRASEHTQPQADLPDGISPVDCVIQWKYVIQARCPVNSHKIKLPKCEANHTPGVVFLLSFIPCSKYIYQFLFLMLRINQVCPYISLIFQYYTSDD